MEFPKEISDLLQHIHIDIRQLILALTLIGLTWILQRYFIKTLFEKIISYLTKRNSHFYVHVYECYSKPVRYTMLACSIVVAVFLLAGIPLTDNKILLKLIQSILIFYGFWGIYLLLDFYAQNPKELSLARKVEKESVLLPFFCRIAKYFALGFAFSFISFVWGYDVSGLVAGLGIGSLALALGAKDVFSNMFGGMAVAIDKPFSKGDLISTLDRKIEGLVEEVNFRSTKIVTFDKAVLYVPNTFLANQPIINWTRRDVRRVVFQLAIDPKTPEANIQKAISRISSELENHPGVKPENTIVFIDELTEAGFMLKVIYFTNTAEFKDAMNIKQDINFLIARILQEEQVALSPVTQHMTWNRIV